MRDTLVEKIGKKMQMGYSKFIVYPYGQTGIEVKNILHEYFNNEPFMIIDNAITKYNKKIHDSTYLKENYESDMIVIISSENYFVIDEIKKSIEGYVPPMNIIFLNNFEDCFRERYSIENLYIESIIGKCSDICENKKIHISIISNTELIAVLSLCMEIQKDEKMQLLVLVDGENQELKNRLSLLGIDYIDRKQYIPMQQKPDIFILTHPYDSLTKLWSIRRYTKYILVLYSGLYDGLPEEYLQNLLLNYLEKYSPDFYIFDKFNYDLMKNNELFKSRIVEIGNPKYDMIFQASYQCTIPTKWEKLKKKKKIVLWTTDHGIYQDYIIQDVTIDIYAKYIFEFAKKNQDIGFIFRPHPSLIKEMVTLGYWSEADIKVLKEYCEESSNIIFDDEMSYENAYSISDAIITDGFCGIVLSALPMNKPICLTFRNEKAIPKYCELMELFYLSHNVEELHEFLNMINVGDDPLKKKRLENIKNYVANFDGKNGQRIKMFIDKILME